MINVSDEQLGNTSSTVDKTWGMRVRGRKLAIMWLTIAVLGAVFISLTFENRTLRLLSPIILLLGYAFYGWKYIRESAGTLLSLRQARLGQLADSLYFLGFLWTLYALIDSLVIHETSIAEAVFHSFGYALITTALGMFLRLLLLQFSYSEEEQVRFGERQVEEEITRFSKEVGNAITSIAAFRNRTDVVLSEWIESLKKSTERLTISVGEVNTQTVGLKDALIKMQQLNTEHVQNLISTSVSQFIQKVAPPFEEIKKANTDFVKEVNASASKVQTIVDSGTKEIKRILSSEVTTIESSTTKFSHLFGTHLSQLEPALSEILKQIRSIQIPSDIVENNLLEQITKIVTKVDQSTLLFQDAIKRLSKQIDEVRIPTGLVEEKVTNQLTEIGAKLKDDTKPFQDAVTNLSEEISKIRIPTDIVEKTVSERVSASTTDLLLSLNTLQDAIGKLHKSVLMATDHVKRTTNKSWWNSISETLKSTFFQRKT